MSNEAHNLVLIKILKFFIPNGQFRKSSIYESTNIDTMCIFKKIQLMFVTWILEQFLYNLFFEFTVWAVSKTSQYQLSFVTSILEKIERHRLQDR